MIGAQGHARFATLYGARRVWAIAAVHGEARRLVRIHDAIGERLREGDRVVYLGNTLGHGADIRASVDELLDFRRRLLARRGGLVCDLADCAGGRADCRALGNPATNPPCGRFSAGHCGRGGGPWTEPMIP